jgi:hypothetical protein
MENKTQKQQLNMVGVMQRFLVQLLIIIACWHVITIWLQEDTDWYAALLSFLWSGNIFWLKDYSRWFKNVT